ncbi:MAG: hypothetical protein MUE36_13145 [Acidimicrobiales bacterium]|jgi:hypothetical protein|nr:hypothetical protein [Acidimicrobiales bacterium]
MLRTVLKAGAAALLLTATATVLPASPVSSQTAPPTTGYTVVSDEVDGCRLSTIDLATGVVTPLPAAAGDDACVNDLAVAPDGTVWGIAELDDDPGIDLPVLEVDSFAPQAASDLRLRAFSPTTGAMVDEVVIDIADLGEGAFLPDGGLAITPDGTVWALFASDSCDEASQNCLWTIDPTTGVATLVGPTDTFEQTMFGLAACDAGVVTVVLPREREAIAESTPTVFEPEVGFIDPTSGELTDGPALSDFPVGYDCAGTFGFAIIGEPNFPVGSSTQALGSALATFDPATGTTTVIADIDPADADITLLAIPPTAPTPPPTPETPPTTTAPAAQAVSVTPAFTG